MQSTQKEAKNSNQFAPRGAAENDDQLSSTRSPDLCPLGMDPEAEIRLSKQSLVEIAEGREGESSRLRKSFPEAHRPVEDDEDMLSCDSCDLVPLGVDTDDEIYQLDLRIAEIAEEMACGAHSTRSERGPPAEESADHSLPGEGNFANHLVFDGAEVVPGMVQWWAVDSLLRTSR
ncbi:hypothetical protein FGB62_102g011 [Gracilaria domingensis]|nr:hypothetical protein FGB62_102g011 [Gracilaria domingensis]